MKIVLVSNKPDLEEDYSEFVDSCDIVVRINKLDSITYGKTGTKTDIIFMAVWYEFYENPVAFKHINHMMNSIIYMTAEDGLKYYIDLFKDKINTTQPVFVYDYIMSTTVTHAIYLIHKLYPTEKIYYIGDKSTYTRVGDGHKNTWFNSDKLFNKLENNGILIPLINNDNYMEIWVDNGINSGFYLIKNKKEIIFNKNYGTLKKIDDSIFEIKWSGGEIQYLDINKKIINQYYGK